MDMVQSLNDLAEDGVLAVPSGIGSQADEELARRAVRVVRPRGADRAALEGARAEFGGHSGLARIAQTPHRAVAAAAGLRIAALNDEIGKHTVEARAVIKFLVDQLLEILDVAWRDIGVERNLEIAIVGFEDSDFIIKHGRSRGLWRRH